MNWIKVLYNTRSSLIGTVIMLCISGWFVFWGIQGIIADKVSVGIGIGGTGICVFVLWLVINAAFKIDMRDETPAKSKIGKCSVPKGHK